MAGPGPESAGGESLDVLRSEVARLADEVRGLRERVERLESARSPLSEASPAAPVAAPVLSPEPAPEPAREPAPVLAPASAAAVEVDAVGKLTLLGRTLMEFAGAYMLRAASDGKMISGRMGALLGLGYAAVLLVVADRGARARRVTSAGFHAVTAAAIAFPLLIETGARLRSLSPLESAVLLLIFTLAGLFVARRHGLELGGWATTLLALGALLWLMRATGHVMTYVTALWVLVIAAELLLSGTALAPLRWPIALCADFVLLAVVSIVLRPDGVPEEFAPLPASQVVGAALTLPLLYIASIGGRTVLRGGVIAPFGMVQGPLAVLVGLSSAGRVLTAQGSTSWWVMLLALALAVGSYATAFGHASRRAELARNFWFHTTVGGLLILCGTAYGLTPPMAGIAWMAVALGALGLTMKFRRNALALVAAAFACAASEPTGLLGAATDGLVGAPAGPWDSPGVLAVLEAAVLAATFVALTLARRTKETKDRSSLLALAPILLSAGMAAYCLGGLVVRLLAPLLTSAPGADADQGMLATLRTGVLACAAVLMALAGRRDRSAELRWFAPPILVFTALKVVFEDLPRGRPGSQFLTFALYGAALILAPRLMRRADSNEIESAPR